MLFVQKHLKEMHRDGAAAAAGTTNEPEAITHHFLLIGYFLNEAAYGLWSSTGLKMPIHADFWVYFGHFDQVGQAGLFWYVVRVH